MNPLRINLGDDPKVKEFIRHVYGTPGFLGEPPPELSAEQLKEVDWISNQIADAEVFHDHEDIEEYVSKYLWLVAGHYCGGTKFAASFLRKMGIEAAHEEVFNLRGEITATSMVACQRQVEVSGGIPVWLPMFPHAQVISLMRHPVDMLNSQYHFEGRPEGPLINLQRDLLVRLELIDHSDPKFVWRIESESDQLEVLDIFRLSYSEDKLDHARRVARNSKKKPWQKPVITWDDLTPRLQEMANYMGYDKKGLK